MVKTIINNKHPDKKLHNKEIQILYRTGNTIKVQLRKTRQTTDINPNHYTELTPAQLITPQPTQPPAFKNAKDRLAHANKQLKTSTIHQIPQKGQRKYKYYLKTKNKQSPLLNSLEQAIQWAQYLEQ